MAHMIPLIERIMRHVQKTDIGCWLWQGSVINSGYGKTGTGGRQGKDILVHVAMYELHHGPVPTGMDVDHDCRNRLCCNPEHLKPLTRLRNLERGRHPNMVTRRTGICKRGHQIDGENALVGCDGRKRCRACTNMRKRSYWHGEAPPKVDCEIREDKGDFIWRAPW